MPNKNILEIANNALLAIKESDMVVEINMAGYRKPIAEAYPSLELLQEVYKLGIPITFSSDAHSPEQVSMFEKEIIETAKQIGFTKCAVFKNRKREMVSF